MQRKIVTITLIFDTFFAVAFVYLMLASPGTLVRIRQSLFTEISQKSIEAFEVSKQAAAQHYDFIVEEESQVRAFSEKLTKSADFITPEVRRRVGELDIAHKAQFIASLYSSNGGTECGDNNELLQQILRLRNQEGWGCCSDHAEVFIALSHVFGLSAREVHHTSHTFNEVYEPNIRKWLWIDTMYAIMAQDEKENYLSLVEIMSRMRNGEEIFYDFFGGPRHMFSRIKPSEQEYYNSADDFAYIMLTLGDNVFSQDSFNTKISFLPKPIRQMISLTMGIQPKYLVYAPTMSSALGKLKAFKIMVVLVTLTGLGLHIPAVLATFKKAPNRS